MSVQSQIDRITNEVGTQADLIAQINAALEGKVGSGGGITPTGTKQITANGTHDVTTYASAEVNVPVGVFPTGTLDITANGTHNVSNYENVNVNVQTGGDVDGKSLADSLIDSSFEGVYSSSNVQFVSVGSFFNCKGLTGVSFPEATFVGERAFSGCISLTEVYFPKIESVQMYAFQKCAFSFIDLPFVKTLVSWAFENCKNLITVVIRRSAIATLSNKNVFTGTPIASGTGYVYVPSALVDSYKAASNWSTYAAQIRAIEDYPDITGG